MSPATARTPTMSKVRTDAAIVHDGFIHPGGAERVVTALAEVFGGAPVYASGIRPGRWPDSIDEARVATTFVQPAIRRGVPATVLAPVLPAAFARLDLSAFDLVISSSAAFAHHARPAASAAHVCYCHTPPRFLWEPDDYFLGQPIRRALTAPGRAALRRLDRAAARRVDLYVANSRHVAEKIRLTYGRDALVVHPPVDVARFRPSTERSGRFLVVSRLRNQKRVDLAIAAANLACLPLDVIGEGPELGRLQRIAGPSVRFLGPLPDPAVRATIARSAAVVVPAVQDFGLALVEAQASGRPPVAFAEGGAAEIVDDGATGFLFTDQSAEALARAMLRALRHDLDPEVLVRSAARFDVPVFRSRIRDAAEFGAERHRVRLASRGANGRATGRREPRPVNSAPGSVLATRALGEGPDAL